jgi:hypothetical protein
MWPVVTFPFKDEFIFVGFLVVLWFEFRTSHMFYHLSHAFTLLAVDIVT